MKRAVVCVLVLLLCAVAWAMPLGSSARTAIPSDIQQIISVDYRALKGALDARDGYTSTVDANSQIADMIGAVDSGMVWSVLDQQGTQNMLRSALGDAAGLADYDTVKKRILGSRYTMNFSSGVNFD